MAEVDPETIEGEGDKQGAAQPRKHDEQHAAALDKVTDYVEEQLIVGDIGQAISNIRGDFTKQKEAKALRDRELAKVVIRKEDVELIMNELDISKTMAERGLREQRGDVVQALLALIN